MKISLRGCFHFQWFWKIQNILICLFFNKSSYFTRHHQRTLPLNHPLLILFRLLSSTENANKLFFIVHREKKAKKEHNQILNHVIINTPPGDSFLTLAMEMEKGREIPRFEYFRAAIKLHSWCFMSIFIIWKIFSCSSGVERRREKLNLLLLKDTTFTLYSFLVNKFLSLIITFYSTPVCWVKKGERRGRVRIASLA